MSSPDITLYTAGTPNGFKIPIALEELGLPYKFKSINLSSSEQKEAWFLKINPNGRIPAIVDHSRGDYNVFESGAILLYLVEHYDKEGKIWPKTSDERNEVIQWLMFQMAGVGPMQGQAVYFLTYAPEKIPYAIKRYKDETLRLYSIIESHLAEGREYLAGGQYTIADIATFPWVHGHERAGVSLDAFPHITAWHARIAERPAVKKGLEVK